MKYSAALALVPLLTLGCGSSPAAPSSTVTPAPSPVILAMSFTASPSGAGGFTTPTTLTLTLHARGTLLRIETASYKMLDAQGQVLAEAFLDAARPGVDPNRFVSDDTIAQTLSWPADRGKGVKLDLVLTVRDSSGGLKTQAFSIPAR